ncbi:9403_t:CDS:1, partial [Racocetra persica]
QKDENKSVNNLVKVKCFYGTDDEDPFEWFAEFERAAKANNWTGDRRFHIASGYLKGIAADWYSENEKEINEWKTEDETEEKKSESFYHRFVQQFAPEERQHRWAIELGALKQQELE